MFIKIHGKFMYSASCSDSFKMYLKGIIALKGIFSVFPLAGFMKRIVYLKMSH